MSAKKSKIKSLIESKVKSDNERFKSLIESKVKLDREERGILRYLGNKEEALDLAEIMGYLKNSGYDITDKKETMEKIDHLIDVGYVRSETTGTGGDRKEQFYLATGLGGGRRRRKYLQGRGILYDTNRLVQRLTGSVFALVGFGFLVYQGIGMTGAFMSSPQEATPTFLLSLLLFLIGGLLLRSSVGKK